MALTTPPRSDLGSDVLALPWSKFLPWFGDRWKPGQHVALIGPTGVGKSTFAVGILPLRKYVLALDTKGGDSTLRRLESQGFQRIASWPPPKEVWRDIEEGRPARLIVGAVVRTRDELPALRQAASDALDAAFDMGGFTVYVDELQIAADPRMMKLAGQIERNLIAARDKGVSMVTSYQRPANVPRSASEMSRWLAFWYTRDVDVVNRLAEMAGRSKAEIRGAVRALEENAILLFSQNPNDPIVATRAPKA